MDKSMVHVRYRPAAPTRLLPPLLFLALVIALVAMGLVVTLETLTTPPARRSPAELAPGPFAVTEQVATSFGAITVEDVARADGLTQQQMGGMPMGNTAIMEDQVQIEPTVLVTNGLDRPLDYSPDLFRLIPGAGATPIELAGANSAPIRLLPGASMEIRLIFVAPRDGAQLFLEFGDPGRPQPVRVDLGRTDYVPQDGAGHDGH